MEFIDDMQLARELQEQFDKETSNESERPNFAFNSTDNMSDKRGNKAINNRTEMSLVDPQWEILDPSPDIRVLFIEFNDKYFWGKLSGIEVKWSQRMTLCAGLCVYEGHGGLCSVRLSAPLLKLRPRKDMIETLLHEMIHAYLFVTANNKDHDGHGPEFHKHMNRLNTQTGTKISVYHNFHDEVDNYRQHWWKCDGPCQKKPPYFGFVRRAMNRAPSPRDPWWPQHQQSCGGKYTKVKEPEGYGEKKKKKESEDKKTTVKKTDKPNTNADIRDMWKPKENKMPGVSNSENKNSANPKLPSTSSKSSNIHTFGGKTVHSDEIRPTGSDEEDEGWKPIFVKKPSASSAESVPSFSGKGKSLGGSSGQQSGAGPIVRKLPGIGVVTCNRTTSDNTNQKSVSAEKNVHKAKKKKEWQERLDALFTDSSDDEVIPPVKKPTPSNNVKQTSISKHLSPNLPVGDKCKVEGFTSVSNRSSAGKPSKRPSPSATVTRDEPSVSNKGFKRPAENDLAADRNKRAHYITSSEEDSDIDESMTLISVVRKKPVPPPKMGISDSDSDSQSLLLPSSVISNTSPSGSHRRPTDFASAGGATGGATNDAADSAMATTPTETCDCPCCGRAIPLANINQHLDTCLS